MALPPVNNNYAPSAMNAAPPSGYGRASDNKADDTQKVSPPADKDTYTRSRAAESAAPPELKKLSSQQLKEMQAQREASFQKMLTTMLTSQADKANVAQNGMDAINAQLFSRLTVTQEQQAAAAQAISEDGEWGVNAVATRIVDMAVSLSSGDPSKVSQLRSAVEKGFQQAGMQWGQSLPSICQDTYDEVGKRFDYWEEKGSMDGYQYEPPVK